MTMLYMLLGAVLAWLVVFVLFPTCRNLAKKHNREKYSKLHLTGIVQADEENSKLYHRVLEEGILMAIMPYTEDILVAPKPNDCVKSLGALPIEKIAAAFS